MSQYSREARQPTLNPGPLALASNCEGTTLKSWQDARRNFHTKRKLEELVVGVYNRDSRLDEKTKRSPGVGMSGL